MDLYIGGALIPATTLHAMARDCRDGSDLVDRLVPRCPAMTHDEHMSVLRWYHKVATFRNWESAKRFR